MEFGPSLAQIPKPYNILYMPITSLTQIATPYKILYKPGLYEEFNRGDSCSLLFGIFMIWKNYF